MATTELTGRIGNNFFQIANAIAYSKRFGHELYIPYHTIWNGLKDLDFDSSIFKKYMGFAVPSYQEETFHYRPIKEVHDVKFKGYFQSEKYFEDYKDEVKKILFKLLEKHPRQEAIAVSVRRGDFVYNTNYELLPEEYYNSALKELPDLPVYVFTDDPEWCKKNIKGDIIVEGTPIEQLSIMASCKHFIISNSTFSWWGAWLGERKDSVVYRPPVNFASEAWKNNKEKDYWPLRWKTYEYRKPVEQNKKKHDLKDVTFIIPASYDHRDRDQNMQVILKYLTIYFDANIIVGENRTRKFEYCKNYGAKYIEYSMRNFHRTKILNLMSDMADTPIVVNYDCDVVIPPEQMLKAVNKCRKGTDFVYPYDGRFARVPRGFYELFRKDCDFSVFENKKFKGTHKEDKLSVGGAVIYNKESFNKAGKENEKFISHAPEDVERFYRFNTLGYKVEREDGILYHFDHFVGKDSGRRHEFRLTNKSEYNKIKRMSKEELLNYVKSWNW